MNSTISLSLNADQIHDLESRLSSLEDHPGPYMRHQYRAEGCVISVYTSGKAVFQGKNAEKYASIYRRNTTFPQAGSDEVGTGDVFGPVCVCAVLLKKENDLLAELRDSKKIQDEKIRELGPDLMKLPHSLLIVSPEKYNEVQPSNNMNRMKARLHNQCYVNLQKKYGKLPDLKVIDQFTPEGNYYAYLSEDPVVIRGITFQTKAEDKYPSVGAASMISRYAFLLEMDKMSERYKMEFPKGAGKQVDEFLQKFINKYSQRELPKAAKMNFSNIKKIMAL